MSLVQSTFSNQSNTAANSQAAACFCFANQATSPVSSSVFLRRRNGFFMPDVANYVFIVGVFFLFPPS